MDVSNHSFHVDVSFVIPDPVPEESLPLDDTLEDVEATPDEDAPVTYHEVDAGSKRGKPKLVDNRGFSYTVKKSNGDKRCIKRSGTMNCPATVMQDGNQFRDGRKDHVHAPEPGVVTSVKIRAEAKSRAMENVFTVSGPRIVDEVYREHGDIDQPHHSRPKAVNVVRAVNRLRQSMRPKDPKDLDFELASDFLDDTTPGFYRKDVVVDGRRHLLFMTDRQLDLLGKTHTWYMDGTFRVVNDPWTQLFSIHGMVRAEWNMKQVALAFCFMSGKREEDYYAILRAIDRMLPRQNCLERCVVDFEAGLWQAIRHRFPEITIQGCAFHWTRAVFRKVQELGLKKAYEERGKVHQFISEVMAIHYLPQEHIFHAFDNLRERASSEPLLDLMNYIERTWMRNRVFPVRDWCVFMQSIRTNNDVEGWHHRLNTRVNVRGPVPFYLLIQELYKEATSIPLVIRMVTEGKLRRYQRKRAVKSQRDIFRIWRHYDEGRLTSSQLLKKAASLVTKC